MASTATPAKNTPAKKAPAKKAAAKRSTKFKATDFICNLVPSTGTESDWNFANSVESGALTALQAPPASVDLRAPWWAIDNQEQTGSCVGWATAEGVGRYHMQKASKITTMQLLSARYVWMASKETDTITTRPESFVEEAGTTLKAAVEIGRKYGLALEAELPFHIQTAMFSGNENTFFASCAQRRFASYFNLQKNLANWKVWLASNGPILAGLSVEASWDNATATGGNIDTFQPGTVRGGHAIAVVGYRADGRFIIRNSWGTGWGDQGFGYVSPDYINAGFFGESYGVTL